MKKVLFIQHATAFGGSAMSLLYTLQGIQKMEGDRCKLVVALAKYTDTLATFYGSNGFEVVKPDWIDTYEHTQALSYQLLNPVGFFQELMQRFNIRKASRYTRALMDAVKPDIVHLNSVVLLGSAMEISAMGVPLVWHVREHPVIELLNMRTRKMIKALKTLPNNTIFICKADQQAWGNPENGTVVYNFIDFDKFNSTMKPKPEWGIDDSGNTFYVLFLGGMNKVKGTIVMMRAFAKFRALNPGKKMKLIFAGGKYNSPDYFIYKLAKGILPRLGWGTYSQLVEKEIEKLQLEPDLIRLPFEKDVARLFSASDVLVFPSIRPHFARPVIEAGAMSLPVLGSRLGGVEELIDEGENGYLFAVDDHTSIAQKLNELFHDPEKRLQMGAKGYEKALTNYSQDVNIQQIIAIYDELVAR